MTYAQIIYPDLNTVGNVGWCLSFAEDAYNTPHFYATATDAWKSTEYPHDGYPPNAQVPIWFSYYEGQVNYGHVAIWVPGRGVLSSPYKKDNSQQWFGSIEECERVLKCSYLGWSEDIATVRVVTKEEEIVYPNEGDVQNAYLKANDRNATPEEVAVYTGKPWSAPDGLLYGKIFVDLLNFKEADQGEYVPYKFPNLYEKKGKL